MDLTNELPDHVLTEIFGNLSPNMIKSCSLVCKRWDKIIGNSIELMKGFKLNLKNPPYHVKKARELMRKYQAVIAKELSKNSLDVISRYKLKYLKIDSSTDTCLSTLIEALENLPSLKAFVAENSEFIEDICEDNDCSQVKINLEELRCDTKIIHIFDCSSIELLKIDWMEEPDDMEKTLVIDFVKRQKNLKKFELLGNFSGEFFSTYEIFEFKLKEFKLHILDFYDYGPLLYYETFIKFLQQFKNSLTSLELCFYTDPPFAIDTIHKFILENMLNLKHLWLGYPAPIEELLQLEELLFVEIQSATQITRNIESLRTNQLSNDNNENKRFLAMFPNLKQLSYDYLSDVDLLRCISEINVNLECIRILDLDIRAGLLTNAMIHFPKLKEMYIYVHNDNLCSFINRHSKTLEKICIEERHTEREITTDIVKEIINCENLKYLKIKFSEENYCVLDIFEHISSINKPFIFSLRYKCLEKKFIFPDDKAVWVEEVESLKHKIYDN